MEGIIIKGIGGFYYVLCDEKIYECKARGKFRHVKLTPMVGDEVSFDLEEDTGQIINIHERKNFLIRPPVANVTKAFIVTSLINPNINIDLLNNYILICNHYDIEPIVCFNKMDLIENSDEYAFIAIMLNKSDIGYLFIEAKNDHGLDPMKNMLKDNLSILCGVSGTGKSTIFNKLTGDDFMDVGDLSEKITRGKNTTRHCQLASAYDGYIVDTPGFSSLSFDLSKMEIRDAFKEFKKYERNCKFRQCFHYKEPSCAVKKAVEDGELSKERYDFYVNKIENSRRK